MGLTRITAQQISNIDYKQSVRAVTVSNITLSGGAPATVDGVSLVAGDRILVTGQSTSSQNGLYYVTVLGVGSNGTWARSGDADATGEIDAGMIVMVTEGTLYADTQWKLITNDPITVGSTGLTFTQNYLANSISSGTSNVVVSSSSNVSIAVAGSNVAVFASTGEYVTGLISATGNITGGNLTTAGQVSATGNVSGGNLNVTGNIVDTGALTIITGSSGNINLAPNGTNVLIATTTGANITGTLNATGNANVGNIGATAVVATNLTGTLQTAAQTNITSVGTLGSLSVTGNITGGNILGGANVNATTHTGTTVLVTGNITGGNINTVGNIAGNYILGNGAFLSGVITSVANINNGTSNVTVVSSGGNITVGVGGTGNVVTFATTGATVTGIVSATGNITGGNLITAGVTSATGNITTSNYFVGNGAFLTGISAAISVSKIENGNSNVWVQSSGGEIAVTVTGIANVAVFGTGALTLVGGFANPKTISRNVIIPNSVNAMLIGPITIANSYNLTVPTGSTAYMYL